MTLIDRETGEKILVIDGDEVLLLNTNKFEMIDVTFRVCQPDIQRGHT